MKKQEGKKNRLLWIAGAVLAAALVVAGILLAVSLGGQEPGAAEPDWDGKLYWNVERSNYFGQQLKRPQESDGTVYVRFAVDGEQVRLPVADAALVDHIDTLRVMGLVFDENGVVVDVRTVEEVTGGYFADGYYVQSVNAGTVTCNMTVDFSGISKTFTMDENTQVIYASGSSILVGTPTTVAVDDEVIVIEDQDGRITHVYVLPYELPADIYWNVNRMYDSTTKATTRERNALGYYEYELAVNGQLKTLYTRDTEVANAMDATAAKSFGLEFDEEGYITGVVEAKIATKGRYFASWYHVLEINGNSVYAKKFSSGSDQGQTRTGTLSKNCKIFNVSGYGAFVGEPTTVQVGDQVHGLTDSRGQVCVLFVVNRIVESELYWNVDRKWDSGAKLSTRTPDKNGWYHILLAVNGQQVTLKTQDKDIVQSMDAKADHYFGLEVTDGVITKYYHPNAVTGGSYFASWCDVTEIKDGKVTALRTLDGKNKGTSYTATMAEDCKIYNVSDVYNSFPGEETTLRVGDRIQGQTNYLGELVTIYVVNRLADSEMYWNVERMWDSKKNVSTRTPDENGWYHILLAVNGQQKTFKTKSRELVNTMDGRADQHFGLRLRGDVITAVYTPGTVTGGSFFGSWYDITSIKGSRITVKRMISGSSYGKTDSAVLAPGCEIYNVSTGYQNFEGEPTTLRVGDRIHGETNAAGQLVVVYVVGNRTVDAQLYWNVDRKWDAENGISTRVPDEEGWYHILLAVNGQQVTLKTQNADIVHSIDAKADQYFGLILDGDVITRYCHPDAVTGGSFFASWYDVTQIDNGIVTAQRTIGGNNQGKIATAVMAEDCKVYNVSSNVNEFVGEQTQLLVTDRIQGQKNKAGELVVIYVVNRTAMPETAHTCTHITEDVTWYAWNGKSDISKSGHYVLTGDVTLSAGCRIADDIEVTLCLNGHTVTTDQTAFTVRYGATMTLCDHKNQDGTYSGGVSSAYTGLSGGVFYVYDGGTMNIYGGNYTHTAQCQMAGIGGVGNKGAGATLNIYDGLFSGGNVTKSGGNFYIYAGATMNLYGGTVTGGTAAMNGGNIMADSKTCINVFGGTIENGQVSEGRGGSLYVGSQVTLAVNSGTLSGNVCVNAGGSVILSGKTVMDDLYLENGATVAVGAEGLAEDAEIAVSMEAPGLFADAQEALADRFVSKDEAYKVAYLGGLCLLSEDSHIHCLCGTGTHDGIGEHSCENVIWTAWGDAESEKTSLPTNGYYYLTADITLSGRANIPQGSTLSLCLNGHTVNGPAGDMLFVVRTGLNITDCHENPGSIIANSNQYGSVFYMYDHNGGSQVNLFAGTLTTSLKSMTKEGAIVYTGNQNKGKCVFNMYGGSIVGTVNSDNAGAVKLHYQSTMNLYGGTISGGSSNKAGGNIHMTGTAVLNLYGGTVSGGNTPGNGGNIFVSAGCTLNLHGGTVEMGTAALGGGIYAAVGATVVNEGKTVFDGNAPDDIYEAQS